MLDTCKRLEKYGYRVTYMPVQKDGLIDLDELKRAMDNKTILVSIMAANNEIGVVQPVTEIGKLCRERGIIFHTDATQAIGKIPVDVNKQFIDVMSISAHKMYGPKGVGALYVRRKNPRVQISAIIDGGGHERGMRSGTLNVAGIVGLGKACAIASEEMSQEAVQLSGLRDRLRDRIMSRLDETYINGSMEHRLPGNLNISFAYVEGESLLMGINDIAVSKMCIRDRAWAEMDPLTDRERQVLRLAGEGMQSGDIAAELHLSEGTVRNYLSEAISKMGASNRICLLYTSRCV